MHLPLNPHLSVTHSSLGQDLCRVINGSLVAGDLQDPAVLPYATGQQQLENGHDFMTQAQIHSRSLALHMRQVSPLQTCSRQASIGYWDNTVPAFPPHMLWLLAALRGDKRGGRLLFPSASCRHRSDWEAAARHTPMSIIATLISNLQECHFWLSR